MRKLRFKIINLLLKDDERYEIYKALGDREALIHKGYVMYFHQRDRKDWEFVRNIKDMFWKKGIES